MNERVDGRRLGATLGAIAALFAVQIGLLGPARLSDFLPGFAFDACALLLVYSLSETFDWAVGRRLRVAQLYYAWLLTAWLLVVAYTCFFDVATERKLTPLDLTASGVVHFFERALPSAGMHAMLAGGLAIALCALLGEHTLRLLPRTFAVGVLSVAVAALGLALVRMPKIPSPLYDASFELWELVSRERLHAPEPQPEERAVAMLDKSERTHGAEPTRYAKVIVLVMETMTAQKLEEERAALPEGSFLRSAAVERYTRYYPNNQDSRTGMLDMLFSRLIPYEAYSEAGLEGYRHLAGVPSLVDRMRQLSYASAFVVAQTEPEAVVGELGWDATLHLSEQEIVRARAAGLLCFAPDEWERSCEDVTMLPDLLDFVSKHERAFVYQEFIWGHAAEYNEASGKTNADYYSAYVEALQRELERRGLLEQTLIVLTSDHGFRDRAQQAQPSVYRVPLWFSAPDLPPRTDARLLSHSDLGMLLFEHLTPGAPRADDNELVMIVGPTGQGNLFTVARDGGYALIRRKAGLDMLVEVQGKLPYTPDAILSLFRSYQAHFDTVTTRAQAAAADVDASRSARWGP